MILIWQWITPGSNTLPKSQTMHQHYPPSRADRMPRNYIQCHMRAWVDSCFRFSRFKKKKKIFFYDVEGVQRGKGVCKVISRTKQKKKNGAEDVSREIGVRQFFTPDGASAKFLSSLPQMLYIAFPARVWETWTQQTAARPARAQTFTNIIRCQRGDAWKHVSLRVFALCAEFVALKHSCVIET